MTYKKNPAHACGVAVANTGGRSRDNIYAKGIVPRRTAFCQGQDLFDECKARVSIREVVECYGFHPNRAGFICCPFHNEKTPSLKIYDTNNSWYCYGCEKGGSVIDFVAELLDLSPLDAAKTLNAEFDLGLSMGTQTPTAAQVQAARDRQEVRDTLAEFESWRMATIKRLNECCYLANHARTHKAPDTWTNEEALAIREYATLENLSDELDSDDRRPESGMKQLAIWRDRKAVDQLCNSILRKNT